MCSPPPNDTHFIIHNKVLHSVIECDPCCQFAIQPPFDVFVQHPSHPITIIEWSDKVKARESHCDVLWVSAGKLSEATHAEHQVLEAISRMLLR